MATIRVLPQAVVDKIAAGEVVQRPASAIKELIENSLDAGATQIQVIVQDATAFTIIDNGHGIRQEDLALACTRHATSKLENVQHLNSISSFGFRGEALASISMVSNLLQITSKHTDANVGYTSSYRHGEPISQPKPTARTVGTTIAVTNLFYNIKTRQNLKFSVEYNHILKLIQAYSVYYYQNVSFTLSKRNKPADLQTIPSTDRTHTIASIVGPVSSKMEYKLQLDGIYTSTIWIGKSTTTNKKHFWLFVNHRLVTNTVLQRAVESVVLQEATSCIIIYVQIHVPPETVDVNVHPTKQEVALLHLDGIMDHVTTTLRNEMGASTKIASVKPKTKRQRINNDSSVHDSTTAKSASTAKSYEPVHKIRVNEQRGALDAYIQTHESDCPKRMNLSQPGAFAVTCTCQQVRVVQPRKAVQQLTPTHSPYASVQSLRKQIDKRRKKNTAVVNLKQAVLVGRVTQHRFLVQCGAKLILLTDTAISEFMYQLAIWQFGGLTTAQLPEPIDMAQAIAAILQLEQDVRDVDGELLQEINDTNQVLAQQAADCLQQKAIMLLKYFGLGIQDGKLTGLPVLLQGHVPSPSGLPLFLLRLATTVNWMDEKTCFRCIARELGHYYGTNTGPDVIPALAALFVPSSETELMELTNLKDLYRVFERC